MTSVRWFDSRIAAFSLILAAACAAADGRVAVIAHRGWHKAPGVGAENSIAACRLAYLAVDAVRRRLI